jgi:predicted phosphodiesterase
MLGTEKKLVRKPMSVKVYTLSDLHVDYKGNLQHLLSLNNPDYRNATLIVPGDATDDLDKLELLLSFFKTRFKDVFFVPGNHEMWVRNKKHAHSLEKFDAIIAMCQRIGVHTQPRRLGNDKNGVWIVPLFSWYTKAHEGQDSLFVDKPGDDQTEMIWSDNRFCDWSALTPGTRTVDYFLDLNIPHINEQYDAPVITFSHFLPLSEIVFPINFLANRPKNFVDPMPEFNFTQVAGTTLLAEQIKQVGSVMHIYGHQHRNRHRDIDGITYVSHCLAYPRERQNTHWRGDDLPKLIWHDGKIDVEQAF